MNTTRLLIYGAFIALALGLPVQAQVITTYSDRATFLAATSATDATGALPSAGNVGLGPYIVGSVTFAALASPQVLDFAEWSVRLPGNELGLSGIKSINVSSASPIGSFGFDFVEPQFDPNVNAAFIDSTFTVSLFNGANGIGSFTFNAPTIRPPSWVSRPARRSRVSRYAKPLVESKMNSTVIFTPAPNRCRSHPGSFC